MDSIRCSCRLEEEFGQKYDNMTFKQLKEECAKRGIVCSGLHYDYVKKLIAYELEQRVGDWVVVQGSGLFWTANHVETKNNGNCKGG